MDKLKFMKTGSQSFKEMLMPSRYYKQPVFKDKIIDANGVKFKHTWA